MACKTDLEIWGRAEAAYSDGLHGVLSDLLDGYERKPGKDEIARVMPDCVGAKAYQILMSTLQEKPRRDVSYYDYGWHLELRSRLWAHLLRGLQRRLVIDGKGTEVLIEDLLGHDIGVRAGLPCTKTGGRSVRLVVSSAL